MAVVGAGIAGLACARSLADSSRVVLFESGAHFGGHAHTVDVTLDGVTHGVDTGFLVFNHRTYPQLLRLFAELAVETAPSEMSFSVQARGVEWSGSDIGSVFAQRRNLLRPRFLHMLTEIARFNRLATAWASRMTADGESAEDAGETIGDFLDRHRFGRHFRDWYFLPMIGCIWSCPSEQMQRFPVATLIRFCHNHGLIQVRDRPQWHTVRGGSRSYVGKMLKGIPEARLQAPVRQVRQATAAEGRGLAVVSDKGIECFDEVVLACHSDQSLALLADATPEERAVLGAVRYHANRAVLHTDAAVLPQRRRAWAAWNYASAREPGREASAVCLHYLINRLQPLPWTRPVVVSLNPDPARAPDPACVLGAFDYSHPVFDSNAIAAQRALPAIQGRRGLWFCGAWTRYGFHEDGLVSALAVADALRCQWQAPQRAAA